MVERKCFGNVKSQNHMFKTFRGSKEQKNIYFECDAQLSKRKQLYLKRIVEQKTIVLNTSHLCLNTRLDVSCREE